MKTTLRWLFGIMAILMFFVYVSKSAIISGILYLITGLFILPFTHNLITKKYSVNLNRIGRYGITTLLLIVSYLFVPESIKKEFAESKPNSVSEKKEVIQSIDENKNEENEETASVSIGEIGFINQDCLGGTSEDNLDELTKASVAKDEFGVQELIVNGKVLFAEKNTKIKLIDAGFTWRKVRLLDGKNMGQAIYIPFEFISK